MNLEILQSIKYETERFTSRLNEAIDREINEKTNNGNSSGVSGKKEAGVVKRAALDLKNELTKITSPKY